MVDIVEVGDLVEIVSNNSGALPVGLMSEFYRHSTIFPTIFILNGVSAASADEALDAVVASLPLSVAGVRYFQFEEEEAYAGFVPYARRIWASTKLFRSKLIGLGTPLERILAVPWGLPALHLGLTPLEIASSCPAETRWQVGKVEAEAAMPLQGTA